jgi:hypothetical protein
MTFGTISGIEKKLGIGIARDQEWDINRQIAELPKKRAKETNTIG